MVGLRTSNPTQQPSVITQDTGKRLSKTGCLIGIEGKD